MLIGYEALGATINSRSTTRVGTWAIYIFLNDSLPNANVAKMPPDPELDEEDEQYASSEDSDFAPDNAPEPASDLSDSEGNATEGRKRKQSKPEGEDQDEGYDNSGDEAIIAKGHKRRKRAEEKGRSVDVDEGGEGGLVKTRAQRALE
jgi:hypothetical protein